MNTTYRKLKDCSFDELKDIYQHNRDFASAIDEEAMRDYDLMLQDEYEGVFGKNNNTIRYHDNYSSFYLTVADPERFANTIDSDYLDEVGQELYETAKRLTDEWENLTFDEQQDDTKYEALETACRELLAHIEQNLHSYENNYDEGTIDNILRSIINEASPFSNWKTDGTAVFEEIVKIYR